MTGSCLLHNQLYYNGLMTDLGLNPQTEDGKGRDAEECVTAFVMKLFVG